MFVDTHCHMNMMVKQSFDTPLQESDYPLIREIIKEAQDAQVGIIVNVGTSLVESSNCVAIAQHFQNVFATVGIHPCDASDTWKNDFIEIVGFVKEKERNKIVGIGEVGLDFFHKPFNEQRQKDCLKAHLDLGLEHGLAFSFHVRNAGEEFLYEIEPYKKDISRAVIHCFQQDKNFAQTIVEWGFYVGVDAPITYPKAQDLRDVLVMIPLEHIVLETDAPFLPPQELRGKQNRPVYIPRIAQALADIKGVTLETLATVTTKNARTLFGL